MTEQVLKLAGLLRRRADTLAHASRDNSINGQRLLYSAFVQEIVDYSREHGEGAGIEMIDGALAHLTALRVTLGEVLEKFDG